MKYYIQEYQIMKYAQNTAGSKARNDVNKICENMGYKRVLVPIKKERNKDIIGIMQLIYDQFINYKNWKKVFGNFKQGDVVVLQFPLVSHCLNIGSVMQTASSKGTVVILLVHDLESFRMKNKKQLNFLIRKGFQIEENSAIKNANYIILHNQRMIEAGIKLGIAKDKIFSLEIFDYLIPEFKKAYNQEKIRYGLPIIIAGNLRRHKAEYLYKLPINCNFNLFGIGYESQNCKNISYYGSFSADELPFKLEGSFGLVWDGIDSRTCEGVYGDYLRINSPHKISLYLASGIPVIIWSKAAMAKFILDNKCGITIDSIEDIKDIIDKMNEEEYNTLLNNAQKVGNKLRDGYFTMQALNKILIANKHIC